MEQRVLYRLVIMVMYLVSGFSVGICSDGLIKTYVSSSSSNEVALSPPSDDNASSDKVASSPPYDDSASSYDKMVYSAPQPPLKVPDVSDYSEFISLVVKSPIPVMVEFVDPLCEFCDFIEPSMNQLAQEFAGKCKFYKVDISVNREIASKCGMDGYVPYFMMFKGGFTGMRIRGQATYEELRILVQRYVKLSS